MDKTVSGIWGFIQFDLGGSWGNKKPVSRKPGNNFAGPSRDRERRRVAGHPNYQAVAEETDAAW